jgi:hypothetical protein
MRKVASILFNQEPRTNTIRLGRAVLATQHQRVHKSFSQTIRSHSKFVQDVRYAPSGDHFASVGSDAKVYVYDGKTGETLGELAEGAHKGSIVSSRVGVIRGNCGHLPFFFRVIL